MPRGTSLGYYILYLLIGFLYPAYESIRAVETPDKNDDTAWLIYWIVFAIFNIVQFLSDYACFWLPLYSLGKIVFLLWCTYPAFGGTGSYYLYKTFLTPFYLIYGKDIDQNINNVLENTANILPNAQHH